MRTRAMPVHRPRVSPSVLRAIRSRTIGVDVLRPRH
jgi:hypothetical protein